MIKVDDVSATKKLHILLESFRVHSIRTLLN